MFLELLLTVLAGCAVGIITGLTPGLHINLVSVLLAGSAATLTGWLSPLSLGAFIVGMSVTHTFLDAVPSIYLGAPDEAQAMSALPGHKMLLAGEGHHALLLTVVGAFFSLVCCIALSPLFVVAVIMLAPIITPYLAWILIFIMAYMIAKDKKRAMNLIVFLLSGALGLSVLNMPNTKEILLPMLSGLFGISILTVSLMEKSSVPKQKPGTHIDAPATVWTRATLGATVSGFAASFLPGFSSSQAAVAASQVVKDIGDRGFLVLVGGINTVNVTLSLVTFYAIDKARSGAVVAMREIIGPIDMMQLFILLACALIAGSVAVLLAAAVSRAFVKLVQAVDYRKLVLGVMGFVTLLVIVFSGWVGMLILLTSTALGLFTHFSGTAKNHCMGCLIVPVIIYFL